MKLDMDQGNEACLLAERADAETLAFCVIAMQDVLQAALRALRVQPTGGPLAWSPKQAGIRARAKRAIAETLLSIEQQLGVRVELAGDGDEP